MNMIVFSSSSRHTWRSEPFFFYPSRSHRTQFLPSTCSGSKVEKGGITTTPLEAVTGSLRIRGWSGRPSRLRSSNPLCRTSALTWGLLHLICANRQHLEFLVCFWSSENWTTPQLWLQSHWSSSRGSCSSSDYHTSVWKQPVSCVYQFASHELWNHTW